MTLLNFLLNLNPIKIRFFLFLVFCIGSRLGFTLVSALASGWFLMALGFLALIPVAGWSYILFYKGRDTGIEVLGDKIWWQKLRPIHLLLWLFFAYLAIQQNRLAWLVLLVDTLFGLSAFLIHHWMAGNFAKLK